MDECRKRLRKVGRKGVEGSSNDFYFASLDGNLVLDAGERPFFGDANVCLTDALFLFLSLSFGAALVASVCTLYALVL